MPRLKKMRSKRIRNLIVIFSLTAVILSVSTYAWFIGMRTVNVSSFDVEIASTDSLLLSLDGEAWDTTINISQTNVIDDSYDGNTNSWGGSGLVPVSSIGAMDNDVSRMKIFEKASLTSSPGGYRLLASRVLNFGENNTGEQDGYVAFDLFVKNFSGTQYIKALNELDEEAIYLTTTDSAVSVASADDGGLAGVDGAGIENSVRVAFAQIGRVAGTTTKASTITGINCNPAVDSDVTGICRTAQIWEPNDIKHVANAISWYSTSCKTRKAGADGLDVTKTTSFEGNCLPVVNGTSYETYAISKDIESKDNVDIYDGADYNSYAASSSYLTAYKYFTDTMKGYEGTSRPTFMTLAPNSITKIRIYIYIEGQDVDNYDFASIGKRISVKFGFTKERYIDTDVDYVDPITNPVVDTTKPVITLLGNLTETVTLGITYEDAGATALDDKDGDMTTKIHVINPVDISKADTYTITYNVSDWAGNYAAQVTRTVIVE